MKRENLVVELAAWGLDENPDRPAEAITQVQARAQQGLASLPDWYSRSPRIEFLSVDLQNALIQNAERDDLRAEFHGLEWTLGIVDLRLLVSFQRRLVLDDETSDGLEPHDWTARMQIALPHGRTSTFERAWHTTGLTLTTENPDLTLQWRPAHESNDVFALKVRHGSPFMEVGSYRGRWFLRDGYHRAYRMLRAGIFEVPAVIIQADTLEVLGANRPWFFSEELLFSRRPPLAVDFLADEFILRWNRPARRKVIRVSITEDFELLNSEQEQGAQL